MRFPGTKHLIFGLVLTSVSIALTLLVLEGALRIFYPGIGSLRAVITQSPGGDSRFYVLKPGARITFSGLHQRLDDPVQWQINEGGIRSDRPLPPKSKKFRIATFGDSETFGWSVSLADTFQRRMEQIDSAVEVLNLGTPGYNAENVADHMEKLLPGLKADFIVYLFHRNDLEGALTFSPALANSRLYLLYRKSRERVLRGLFPGLVEGRHSTERIDNFTRQADRMIQISRHAGAPLLIGHLDWRFIKTLPSVAQTDCDPSQRPLPCFVSAQTGFWAGSINLEVIRQRRKRNDGHIPPQGHAEIAELLCRVVSGDRINSCVPEHWQ